MEWVARIRNCDRRARCARPPRTYDGMMWRDLTALGRDRRRLAPVVPRDGRQPRLEVRRGHVRHAQPAQRRAPVHRRPGHRRGCRRRPPHRATRTAAHVQLPRRARPRPRGGRGGDGRLPVGHRVRASGGPALQPVGEADAARSRARHGAVPRQSRAHPDARRRPTLLRPHRHGGLAAGRLHARPRRGDARQRAHACRRGAAVGAPAHAGGSRPRHRGRPAGPSGEGRLQGAGRRGVSGQGGRRPRVHAVGGHAARHRHPSGIRHPTTRA